MNSGKITVHLDRIVLPDSDYERLIYTWATELTQSPESGCSRVRDEEFTLAGIALEEGVYSPDRAEVHRVTLPLASAFDVCLRQGHWQTERPKYCLRCENDEVGSRRRCRRRIPASNVEIDRDQSQGKGETG